MSFSSRRSAQKYFPPNGRKRRLSSPSSLSDSTAACSSSNHLNDKSQSKLSFPSSSSSATTKSGKRLRLSDSDRSPESNNHHVLTHPKADPDAQEMAGVDGGDTNHKHLNRNSFSKVNSSLGTNHTARKPQAKKLVIKNRKVKPDLPEHYEEHMWQKLSEAVEAVHSERPISYSLEELYQAVENMCSHKMATKLYDKLRTACQRHAQSLVPTYDLPLRDMQFLVVVNKQWTDYCRQMIMIRSIFLYLDRTYAVPNTSLLSLWDLGLDFYGSLIVSSGRVQSRVVKEMLVLVHKERCGESVDRGLLKNLVRMLVDLQMYQGVFEIEFLRETEVAYRAEALRMMRDPQFTLPDYLAHVDKRLAQENDRLLHYLHKSTRKPLIMCVEKQLVGEHMKEILDKGFESLLDADRYSDLRLLYQLFLRFKSGVSLISKAFSGYIKKSGTAIVVEPERDKNMVQELLALKIKVDVIILQSFSGNDKLHLIVRDALESVVNQRQNKPAELIAKYVDLQLRSGNKEWSDEELDKLLDRIMVLFRCIQGKDVFEAFYKKDLAKRLLLGKSASFDAEKSMLMKLKQECGPNFTSKLEGMFKDMELSRELMISFREIRQGGAGLLGGGAIDLVVNVLTMGYWPTYTPMEVSLPGEMAQYLEAFKTFYLGKHNGRKLQWQPSLGYCVVKAAFPAGVKELQVSLFQTMVVLLFNSRDKMTYIEIKEATAIEEDQLKRTLQSLALGKARVLLKQPKGKEIEATDEFFYNKDFKHRMCRIKINQVQLRETNEENSTTNERVFQDRQYQIDAAIVRIMKMRRTLPHNLLLTECVGQLSFHVRPADLKKRVESLIDRDYIRRSKENTSVYEYIA